MQLTVNSVLVLLYVGLIYFPSGFLYINDSDFLFEKLTALVLLGLALLAFTRKKMSKETGVLMAIFMTFMLLPLFLNICDLTASESGLIDSLGQFIRIFIYIGVVHFINMHLLPSVGRAYFVELALLIIRVTVYGQALIFIARAIGLNGIVDGVFLSKAILFTDDRGGILKYDGSLGNPNYFGYLLCLVMLGLFFLRKFISKKECIFLFLMTIGMIVISGSRTSFIVLLVELALFYPVASAISFIALFPFIEIILQVNDRLFELFEALVTSGTVETFEIRRDLVQQSLSYVSQRPFFGHGYRPIEMTDNFFVTHLMRYGWIGLISHAAIILFVVYRTSKSFRYIFLFLAPVLIFNYTGAFIDNFRLYFATVILFIVYAKVQASDLTRNGIG